MQRPSSHVPQWNPYHQQQTQQQSLNSTGVAYPQFQASPGYYLPHPPPPGPAGYGPLLSLGPSQVVNPVVQGPVYYPVLVGCYYVPFLGPPQTLPPVPRYPAPYQPTMSNPGVVLDASGYPLGPPPQVSGYPTSYPPGPGTLQMQMYPQINQNPSAMYTQAYHPPPSAQISHQPQWTSSAHPVQSPQAASSQQWHPMTGHPGSGDTSVGHITPSFGAQPTIFQQYSEVPNTGGSGLLTVMSRSQETQYVQMAPSNHVLIVMPSTRHQAHKHKSRYHKSHRPTL